MVIFFTVPRLGRPAWRGAILAPRSLVGFSDSVTLGEMGEILESREEVMRVQLFDASNGRFFRAPKRTLSPRGGCHALRWREVVATADRAGGTAGKDWSFLRLLGAARNDRVRKHGSAPFASPGRRRPNRRRSSASTSRSSLWTATSCSPSGRSSNRCTIPSVMFNPHTERLVRSQVPPHENARPAVHLRVWKPRAWPVAARGRSLPAGSRSISTPWSGCPRCPG